MALKILPIECLRKGTIKREQEAKEMAGIKEKAAKLPRKFLCRECDRTLPWAELADYIGLHKGSKRCKSCVAYITALQKGTAKFGSNKQEAYFRNKAKSCAKGYKKGKLPGWMFS